MNAIKKLRVLIKFYNGRESITITIVHILSKGIYVQFILHQNLRKELCLRLYRI